jgi:flagellar hook-associated protein 3 FlgL
MLSRTGDAAHHQQMTQLLLAAQGRLRATQAQIGSGKVAERFRELAPEANRLLAAKDALQRIDRFTANNQLVDGRLQVMEQSLASLEEIGGRLKNLLIRRLDASAAIPGSITPEALQLLDQAVADLNVAVDGRHLFAGSHTDTPPVQLDPAFAAFGDPDDTYYQGDDVALTVRADVDREITYGMTADQAGMQELIGALRAAIEGDGSDDRALLESALALVGSALPKLADDRAELGARQVALEVVDRGHADAEVYLQQRISDIEDVDLAEAVTRLTQDQLVMESSMATLARLSRVSLLDYLR